MYHPFLRRLRNLPMPFITSVNGPAAGVGMSFAMMGDLILCAKSSYFLQAFRRIGLVPDGGSTWLLPRLVGKARAMELSLLGEKLPAETALEWGLVNRVYDDADVERLPRDGVGVDVVPGVGHSMAWDDPSGTARAIARALARS